MTETVLKIKVGEFLSHKREAMVKMGTFGSEENFLKSAVEDKSEDAFGIAVDTVFPKQKKLGKNFSYDNLPKEV